MIDTQAIRNKILDLAMRGQLTEQLPEDGTAEELYQKIQEEKQSLIKFGKIKKGKKLPEIEDTEIPFEIPENWKWVRLQEITSNETLNDGNWVLSNDMVDNGPVKLIQLGSIGDLKYRDKGFKYLTNQRFDELNGKQIYPGYLLINRLVADKMLLCIIPEIKGILITAVDVCWVAPQDNNYNIKYLMYALASSCVQQRVKEVGYGVTRFRISKSNLINIPFPFPPLAEQQRIVEKIDQAFSLLDTIDALQAQYADNLTALKAKLIDAAIQGKLTKQLPEDGTAEELYDRVQEEKTDILKERKGRVDKIIKEVGDDVPYDIPAHWKWIRFGELGLFKKGPFGSALTKSMFVPKGSNTVKVYEQQHAIKKDPTLGTYYITKEYFDAKMNGFEVKSGDILISCAGTIGETYVMPDGIEKGIINQALMRVTLASGINKRFFQYYFDSNLKSSARAGNGSAIVNIPPFDVIKNWYFPLAPIEEQERIVTRLEEIFAEMKM
ncbi:MAG: restriction endonuclease subunit S [Oscillospiraceae bacterium]|nr:restriction endonuclease subunit S [Oscillospiraceae bacterium]